MHIHTLDRDKVSWVGILQWNKDMNKSVKQEVGSPIQEVTSLGKDAVVGDQQTQSWAEHQNCWQQQVEMLSECSVAQEVGYQVRHEHKRCVKEHLFLNLESVSAWELTVAACEYRGVFVQIITSE